jgi:hypothetical protein
MKKIILPALAASVIVFSGCNGGSSEGAAASSDPQAGLVYGPTCQNGGTTESGEERLCVALKYVAYADEAGKPVVSQAQAIDNVAKINGAWDQCGISFQIDQYEAIDPADYGLTFATANQSELDSIRQALMSNDKLLIVTTGKWNRAGSLGSTGANAWTTMPGDNIDGAVLESSVSAFPLIIAHEIGHYLSLGHVNDPSDLMNPVIHTNSSKLTASQCAAARDAIHTYWKPMKR